jgi:rod shape-determining protein MreC
MARFRNVSILAAAIFIQVLGLAVQVKRARETQSSRLIRVWAVTALTPLEKAIVRIEGGASSIWHDYFYLRGVRQENRALRGRLEQLELEEVRLRQDADQAHRLQALLGFKEQFISKTAAAQVIGSSGSEQSRTIYIDKGSRDGIQPDMAVISAEGVVGKVIAAYRSSSQVLLVNDQQSGVGAILDRSRLQGVLKGKASGELMLDKIMAGEDVRRGDKVLTSGGDQIFPKGLAIGTVERVSKGPEFLQLTVKPAAQLSHLEEVLIIVNKEERQAPASLSNSARAADILAERLPAVPDKPAEPASPAASAASRARAPLPTAGQPLSAAESQKAERKTPAPVGAGGPLPAAAQAKKAAPQAAKTLPLAPEVGERKPAALPRSEPESTREAPH